MGDNLRSSDICELVFGEDDPNEDSESDIETGQVPEEVSLEDYSSGSGEEYVPDPAELSSSDESDGSLKQQPDTSRPVHVLPLPNQGVNPPIPLGLPVKPTWVRVNPPEPEINIERNFQVRNTGPRNLPPRNSPPVSYFYLFFPINVLNHIVRHTNYYANSKIQNKTASNELKRCSRLNQWVDVTFTEIKMYFAILIINMGPTVRKNMSAYWDTKPSQVIPFYSKTMARNKFFNIHSNLHLTMVQVLRRGQPGYDPWSKVRYLFDHLNTMLSFTL